MAYIPILDSEVDAESPITESLMTRLRDNALAFAQQTFTVLAGSGTYTVPANISKLRVFLVSGGGGGGSTDNSLRCGGGGGGGRVSEKFYSTTGGASISYSCGAGGAGGGSGRNNGAVGGDTTFGTLTCVGGHGGGHGGMAISGFNFITLGCGGNSSALDPKHTYDLDEKIKYNLGSGTVGETYCGGHGGCGYGCELGSEIVLDSRPGGCPLPVTGVAGSAGATGGGGGAPMGMPIWIDGLDTYLGAGGNGSSGNGGNATLNGAGGGGGGLSSSGGNGSAGIIFVLPIG